MSEDDDVREDSILEIMELCADGYYTYGDLAKHAHHLFFAMLLYPFYRVARFIFEIVLR